MHYSNRNTMKLHLLRHGKTHQHSDSGRDFDRKLNAKGLAQCDLLGDYFTAKEFDCEAWCSGAVRTRETFTQVAEKVDLGSVVMREDLYLCSRAVMLEALWARPGSDDLLIVGHNFGISDLATYLTDERIELSTGGYICISFDGMSWEEISRGTGTIWDQYRPMVTL